MYKSLVALVLLLAAAFLLASRHSPGTGPRTDAGYSGGATQNNRRSDRERDGLVGPVQTVSFKEPRAPTRDTRWADSDLMLLRQVTYDRNGNMIEQAFYNPKDQSSPDLREVFSYDGEGHKTQETEYDAHGKLDSARLFTYSPKQQLVRIEHHLGDGALKEYVTIAYNEDGQVTDERQYSGDGSLMSEWRYSYESQRKKIAESFSPHGNYKEVYLYDPNGNTISQTRYDSDGEVEQNTTSSYDEKGQLVRTVNTGKDVPTRSELIDKYDDRGNPIETSHYERKELVERSRCTYEYDSRGNWTRAIPHLLYEAQRSVLVRPAREAYRTITYYTD
jgi:antitoxin component YwqK of YwqJK toxin-antitoxin module